MSDKGQVQTPQVFCATSFGMYKKAKKYFCIIEKLSITYLMNKISGVNFKYKYIIHIKSKIRNTKLNDSTKKGSNELRSGG